jgi:hypothetical protein
MSNPFAAAALAMACLWAASTQAAPRRPDCAPLPGVEQAWARPGVRFVLFGEIHGTSETAPLVADAVCLAARTRPVVLALELDEANQPKVDAFLRSTGDDDAFRSLGFGGGWTGISDGRTSVAMLGLIERVRLMRQAGSPVDIRLIDTERSDLEFGRDGAMAANFEALARARPEALIVGLMGNFHTSRVDRTRDGKRQRSVASILGPERTVSLYMTRSPGSAWFCSSDGCKPHSFGDGAPVTPRSVRALVGDDANDFEFSAGMPLTASPPLDYRPREPAA